MNVRVLSDPDEPGLEARWDALAAECGRPQCSATWMLGSWRALSSGDALRVVLVEDRGELIGVGPFVVRQRLGFAHYTALASSVGHRATPLARQGLEHSVATAIAGALHDEAPRPTLVTIGGEIEPISWAALLAAGWPGRASVRRATLIPTPTMRIDGGSFEAWFADQSANFRQQLRRAQRAANAAGVTTVVPQTVAAKQASVRCLARLHRDRWNRIGAGMSDGVERLFNRVAASSGPVELRTYVLAAGDEVASVQAFVACGGEVFYWGGAFAAQWAPLKPSMQGILAAVEDAFARGDRRIDFGGGSHDYKRRFADGEDLNAYSDVVLSRAHGWLNAARDLRGRGRMWIRRNGGRALRSAGIRRSS